MAEEGGGGYPLHFQLEEKGDGVTKAFSFNIEDHEGQACPVRPGYCKLIINRKQSKVDDGDGNLYFKGEDNFGNSFSADVSITYESGKIEITFKDAPAEGTQLAPGYV